VTAVYGVLDSKNRIITFSNAGHNPPILLRAKGSHEELVEGGIALGILEDCRYEERALYLNAGDILTLFTDGVTEATSPGGEMFGEKRLVAFLEKNRDKSARELVKLLVSSINEFTGEGAEQDDLTLIILKAN